LEFRNKLHAGYLTLWLGAGALSLASQPSGFVLGPSFGRMHVAAAVAEQAQSGMASKQKFEV
jgi:hypothetical protein